MKIATLGKSYQRSYKWYRTRQENLQRELESLKCPSWVEKVIKPIAKELGDTMPDREVEILGPFGLGHEIAIHFLKAGIDRDQMFDKPGNVRSITFRPTGFDAFTLGVVDYGTNTGQFPKGSIGEINGGNHPVVPVDEMEVADLVKFIS